MSVSMSLAEHNRKHGKVEAPMHACTFAHLRTLKLKDDQNKQSTYDIFYCTSCLEKVRVEVAPDEVEVVEARNA